ncbi:MAG: HAD family hydrolase [Clostridiales bacterium]|jgi:HAD superfamily hydrolase (TIGR01509 family)|nr:HAD family hydrolase [Clostridiales bacterium]
MKEGATLRDTVIFDMDGVLIDSQPLHFEIDLEVLRTAGASPTRADVERRAGMANRDRWPEYKREFGLSLSVDKLIDLHVGILMKLFRESSLCPINGIPELLKLLKVTGIKTAVASSSSMALINLVMEKLRVTSYFDDLVTGEDVKNGKPAPDVFIKAAACLNVKPAQCVVIEDSANGVLAAKRAGMRCVAYANPTSGEQDLSPADMIIDSFGQINRSLEWLMDQEELCTIK